MCPPTFGMYPVAARIQGAEVRGAARAEHGFALDAGRLLAAWDPNVKLVFLCSPNNPTANLFGDRGICASIAARSTARRSVVVDEAYIEWSRIEPRSHELARLSQPRHAANPVQGARAGRRAHRRAVADPELIELLRQGHRALFPRATDIEAALRALDPAACCRSSRLALSKERTRWRAALAPRPGCCGSGRATPIFCW